MLRSACPRTSAHTAGLMPSTRASPLITGKSANTGSRLAIPAVYTRFVPNRSWMRPNRKICSTPFVTPYSDRMRPIVCGVRPRPPSAMGVE